ncbi:MAG: ThiF family adenylyltransferase [Candidatus Buchananbacteria bacterium]
MSSINPTRHLQVFSPQEFNKAGYKIDVIGCGATGSRLVLSLAKLGITNIRVWDFDKVQAHNIPNQAFNLATDINRLKVEAIRDAVSAATGTTIEICDTKVDGSQELGDIVFLLTDTMASRRMIWEGAIKLKAAVRLMVETRLGVESGKIYTIHPGRLSHINAWESTLCEDRVATPSACGAVVSVGATAEIISGFAQWQLIRWFQIQQGKETDLANEIIFSLRPPMILTRNF